MAQAREALAVAEDQLRYSRLVAPIDGTVIQRSIRVGETVVPGTMATLDERSLLLIADLSTLIAKVELNQIDVAKIRLGQAVTLTLDALPGKTYSAKVSKIAPAEQKGCRVCNTLAGNIGGRTMHSLENGDVVTNVCRWGKP